MKITLEQVTARHACPDGLDYFKANFGAEAETDVIIKKLLDEKTTTSWIFWLAAEFKLTTVCKSWHDNGQLAHECFCKNGELEGVYKHWRENGQLYIECFYKNGEKDGVCTLWHINGKLYSKFCYKNGEKDGVCTCWHDNGQKRHECFYKNGEIINN